MKVTCTQHSIFVMILVASLSMLFWSCEQKKEEGTDGGKVWKLTMIKYEDLQQTEEAERGFREGLADAGLKEGYDYTIESRSAQGDIPTVIAMLDAAAADGTDMLVSLQTPTLNSAVQRGVGIPLVFMVVANPFVITNVGKSDSSHLPYLTGVYTNTTFKTMLQHIKACIPNVDKIGTLYSSSELNAMFYRSQLQNAGAAEGLKVETVGVVSKESVGAMTELLISSGIQAICQIEDNLTSAAFPSLVKAAAAANIPVFSFVNKQAEQGAVLTLAPDYIVGAKQAARQAAQIIRGESPGAIPFQRIAKFDLIANKRAAGAVGIDLPASIIARADKVIEAR
jgi:putative tryptophan/tyrosine transport system substrate-binding protein